MAAQSGYGKVTDEVVALLTEIVGDKNVLTGDERENYSRDETAKLKPVLPEVVIKPGDSGARRQITSSITTWDIDHSPMSTKFQSVMEKLLSKPITQHILEFATHIILWFVRVWLKIELSQTLWDERRSS